jgi:2-polyprenyl-6-methoxyphenol hydroxylase-like FAD-dependent oxidoreductase
MARTGNHAVVIGASMGGLLAARVLADFYERVSVLERDSLPVGAAARKGVPQGRHAHALLPKGAEIVEGLFPGISRELVERGAVPINMGQPIRWFDGEGYRCRFPSDIDAIGMSRPLLEDQVRARLLTLPNVHAVDDCEVQGLAASADRGRVTGVRIRRGKGAEEEVLTADLVVDASGRGSQAPAWLQSLGYDAPTEDRIRVDIGYTTRLYRRRPDDLDGDLFLLVGPTRAVKRFSFFQSQENDQWLVSLGGYLGDHAPSDDAGFLAFARGLPAPDVYDAIKDAEPLSEPVTHKFPANQRRRYDRLTRVPDGLVVFGDALCSFNPTYGQGMTVASLEAAALQRCLSTGAQGLPRRFYKEAAKVIDVAWNIAAGGDLRFPEVEGPRPPMVKFFNWYMHKLQRAAHRDPVVAGVFVRAFAFIDPPTVLLGPGVMARVLRGNLRRTARDRTRYQVPMRSQAQA